MILNLENYTEHVSALCESYSGYLAFNLVLQLHLEGLRVITLTFMEGGRENFPRIRVLAFRFDVFISTIFRTEPCYL